MIPLASLVDDEIKAVASMASLALALLAFFTNVRRESLKDYLKAVDSFSRKTVIAALPDVFLVLFTGAAVLAMAPLLFDSFSLGDVGTRAGTLSSMLGLIWLGFILLLVFQTWMIVRRFRAAWPPAEKPAATTKGH